MDGFEPKDIDRLRRLGETIRLPNGEEAVQITAQYKGRPTTRDHAAWKSKLRTWESAIAAKMESVGARKVENSLSYSGQTTELVVPIKDLEAAISKLNADDVQVRLKEERRVDPKY